MIRLALAFALAFTLVGEPLAAQMFPFSQRGTVSQTLAFTEISVEYGRPTARGRALFGSLVPWDAIWHPGADNATTLSVSQDIEVEGKALSKGRYTLWLIPRSTGTWTLIINRATDISHTPYPGSDTDVLRVDLVADERSAVEALTFVFPVIVREDAVLRLQWGTLGVNVQLKASYRPATH